ncbi:hypothetical protein RMATCC62417_03713 [Rhizopus microsporus]|nr:hypothetical protein RMATCC62417_03713 [Rhizopus microsporus]
MLFAIYKIRLELHLAWKNEIPGEQYQCDCLSRLNFGLPCQHMMKADGPAVDFQDIHSRWFLDYNRACGYKVNQMKTEGSKETAQRRKISFNEKLWEKLSFLHNDQQREDLLDDLTRSLEKYKAARIDDVDYVAAAIVKGRMKSTAGKWLLSSFEIAEKEAKESETALSRTDSKQRNSQYGTIDYVWPFKRDLEDRIVNNEKKKVL